ncbi:NAD-dependent epimerase/dehydratase family protein [Chitinophaga sp.]|uniref:NAD-dependent epimerase/dehydratase family protein n=1 Tax=Chitinophaga sp. TaxID=1869181 RepID=UPI002F94F4EF
MKNILITGGAGFIGSNLSLKLVEKGYCVTVLDNLSTQIHGNNPEKDSPLYKSILGKVTFIKGSVVEREDLEAALAGQDAIVHYAAETGTGQSMYEVHKYTEVNVGGTALLLDILTNTKHSIKKIIVASSRSIYGEGRYRSQELGYVYPDSRSMEAMTAGDFEVKYPGCKTLELVATDEMSKIHPSSVYGITKQTQEQLVMTCCKSVSIAGVALRYQNVYGPGQSLSNPYTGILSIFSTQIRNGNTINIFEDGLESRDFVYIDDVVNATILCLESKRADNEILNVGAGEATNVLTVANELISRYGIDIPVKINGNFRLGDIRHNYADLSKIEALLGFKPTVSFAEGIGRFAEWVKEQAIVEDKYAASIVEMKEKGLFK